MAKDDFSWLVQTVDMAISNPVALLPALGQVNLSLLQAMEFELIDYIISIGVMSILVGI